MVKLKLMADYYCYPLWHVSSAEFGDIDPKDLPISAELQDALIKWAQTYDDTLDMDTPQNSGFASVSLEEAFKAEGYLLAERLRIELGSDYTVIEKI